MKRSFYIKLLYTIITFSWRLIRAYYRSKELREEDKSGASRTSEGEFPASQKHNHD